MREPLKDAVTGAAVTGYCLLPFFCVLLVRLVGCAEAGAIADGAAVVAGDVCRLVEQDDPTAPQWATVLCTVEGLAAPVAVSLPWSSWATAQGQTVAQAKAARRKRPSSMDAAAPAVDAPAAP